MEQTRHGQNQLISFLWLRRGIGLAGICLPIFLMLGNYLVGDCPPILPAISDYYHSTMRDIFVGVLCILSMFLFSYKGPQAIDNFAANLAGIFALGIAFFPTNIKICNEWDSYENPIMHNISAVCFFLVITYFSLFLFTKHDGPEPPSEAKLKRNKIYRICGVVMLISITVVGAQMLFLFKTPPFDNLPVIFTFEWIALWAFGISWIVKGEMFLEDK